MILKMNEIVKKYRECREDYAFNPDIFCKDEELIWKVKYILDHKLTAVEKSFVLFYAEAQSYRKMAEIMNMSHMTVKREIARIRNIIQEELKKI